MTASRAFPLAAALAAVALAAIPAAAQTVTGTLLEPGGQPVEQVLVALVDNTGHQRAATLTGASGAFTIRAPGPGRYSLRAERIGYTTVVSAAFNLGDGETRTERLVASGRAVVLQALRVSASGRRCTGRTDRAAETATLWEEARKALNATAFGERERLFHYDVVRWTRDLDARTGAVTRDVRQSAGRVSEHPFVSAPPAELSRHGFIRAAEGDSVAYWGPDAEVMLSDEFMNDHCFRVRAGEDGLVGLAFEPARGRAVPDLAGVMWLDRRTAELRRVEYRYVGGPPESQSPHVGGTVQYARLRNGPWIVSRWAIRMPLLQESDMPMTLEAAAISRNSDSRMRVVAVRESGGQVVGTATGDGRLVSAPPPAVQGVVWDSTRNAPLAGARVYFSGTQAETTAGADGRFRLEAPAEGTYTLAFTHPDMGPMTAAAKPRMVTVKPGETATADLAVPGWPAVAAALCPDSTLHPHRGILLGSVRGAAPGDTTLVSATWTRTIVGGRETRSNTQFVATRPDPQGFYVLCGVPEGRPLQLGMRRRGVDEGGTEVRLDAGVPRWQDVAADARAAEADLGGVRAVAAAAGVTVRETGTPAAGAAGMAGFERRRHSGRGVYLARADVERRHAARLVDLFRGLPGVQVVRDPGGERVVMAGARGARWSGGPRAAPAADTAVGALNAPRGDRTRSAALAPANDDGACAAQLWVDGVFTPTERGRISDEVQPADVQALEIYRTATEVPAEYRRQESACGVILVWTQRYARTH